MIGMQETWGESHRTAAGRWLWSRRVVVGLVWGCLLMELCSVRAQEDRPWLREEVLERPGGAMALERLPGTASSPRELPEADPSASSPWQWRLLPDGLVYPTYLAAPKESRFAGLVNYERHWGWLLDLEAGGRVGLFRYGTASTSRPEGWQLDLEGAAFPRLDLEHEEDLIAADFRGGLPLTFGAGPWRGKLAVYHLSSHLGDEFLLRFPEASRINYSRNALVLGGTYFWTEAWSIYGEAEWAFYTDGGTRPWEFQLGIDYSPVTSGSTCQGAPFLAVNGQLRQEVDYGGSCTVQAGWQWRGDSGHRLRIGAQYFAGKSEQYEFFNHYEERIGMGVWYDF